jgi:hypothetical protein
VRPFPNVESSRVIVSIAGGSRPAWARTGRELFYLDAAGLLTSVRIEPVAETLRVSAPATLLKRAYFAGSTVLGLDLRGYDVAPDASRFLMIEEVAPAAASTRVVDVVVGWGATLGAAGGAR